MIKITKIISLYLLIVINLIGKIRFMIKLTFKVYNKVRNYLIQEMLFINFCKRQCKKRIQKLIMILIS